MNSHLSGAQALKPTATAVKWKWIAAVVIVGLLIALAIHFDLPVRLKALLNQALGWIGQLGIWAPVLFIGIYIVACVFFIPGAVLTLGAGALFGVLRGSIYVSLAATLGATAAFLVGRYLARDWVGKKIAGNKTFNAIDHAVAKEGWKIVLLTRLSPVFPFALLNYGFGVTKVSLRDYVLASWIGMMPATVMYTYIGSLANAGAKETTTAEWALRGLGIVATLVVTIILTRIAKRALAKRIDPSPARP